MDILAFISFAALVVAWLVAPNNPRLTLSEARDVEAAPVDAAAA